jgi:DNA-binding NarL/FixJ family response regulator
MDKPLTVLLVEDDPIECERIAKTIDAFEDIILIASTNNAKTALEHTTDYLPDAIILDLELHRGGGDGVSFINALKKAGLPYFPYILVTTNNINPVTHEQVRRLGAGFIMVKSQADYSAESVVDFLRTSKGVIQDLRYKTTAAEASVSPADKKKRLAVQVNTEIDMIGISPKVLGRKYLTDSILMLIEDESQNHIAAVARKYGKSDVSVERAMQNAINDAWRNADIDALQRHYTARITSDKGVPTLTEFVCYYVNKMQMQ